MVIATFWERKKVDGKVKISADGMQRDRISFLVVKGINRKEVKEMPSTMSSTAWCIRMVLDAYKVPQDGRKSYWQPHSLDL
jgi:hypothetical protein